MATAPNMIEDSFANLIIFFLNPVTFIVIMLLAIVGMFFPRDKPVLEKYSAVIILFPFRLILAFIIAVVKKITYTGLGIAAVAIILVVAVVVLVGFIVGIVTGGDVLGGWYQLVDLWKYLSGSD